jgi:formamidase
MPVRIEIDRSQRLDRGAARGHNRWHPDIPPVASVEPGDTVTFEIRDSRDREITRDSTHADMLELATLAHPLTGPAEVIGAQPGDVLELEVLGYETDDFAWTAIFPGAGFLADVFTEPFVVTWELADGVARSEQLPGVAVPACTHAGVIGVAPSRALFERVLGREHQLAERGGRVHPPDALYAWPPEAADGLRTYPPRENGGNLDIRDLGPGARLWLPVHVPGALLSVGDLHFAQGDGEVCIAAIETGGSATFRVALGRPGGWSPSFPAYEAPPRPERRMFATTGIPLDDRGGQGNLDLNLATRRALLELHGWLTATRGLGPEEAYVLMSVAAELRMSEVVDAPNALVSAALPLDIFGD